MHYVSVYINRRDGDVLRQLPAAFFNPFLRRLCHARLRRALQHAARNRIAERRLFHAAHQASRASRDSRGGRSRSARSRQRQFRTSLLWRGTSGQQFVIGGRLRERFLRQFHGALIGLFADRRALLHRACANGCTNGGLARHCLGGFLCSPASSERANATPRDSAHAQPANHRRRGFQHARQQQARVGRVFFDGLPGFREEALLARLRNAFLRQSLTFAQARALGSLARADDALCCPRCSRVEVAGC